MLAAVAQGDLVFIYADDCVERPYDEGEAFVDPGLVHTALQPQRDRRDSRDATVLGVAAGAPAATPIDREQAVALNDACGTDAPVPQPAGASHDH